MKRKPIGLTRTHLSDAFWTPFQKLAAQVVIPYQAKILNDEIPGQEKSHAMANFRIAAGEEQGEFYGMVFQDSDVAKWLEAASYALAVAPDAELRRQVEDTIALVAKAQEPEGYLDTYFMLKEKNGRWKDLLECHELYCMGHMIEAAVGNYESTGDRKLLNVGRGMADAICTEFGPDRYGIPGHEEVEVGLLRLFEATGEEKYLKMAKRFVDDRGVRPDFWKEEAQKRDFSVFHIDPEDRIYNQSFAPVREQSTAEGHAVRAVYLYRAMADLARLTEDAELAAACRRIWEDIENRKLYVTGAIGADGRVESFSKPYDLPGDRAYAETCAQVGLVFFAKAMLELSPEGRYADMMERCLYNSTISGMSVDGTHFFYVNPLEVNPGLSGEVFGMRHVLPERPGWYACACCPPNLARMLLSLGRLCWSESEDTVYSHLFVGQKAELTHADITLKSQYPWEGEVEYAIEPHGEEPFALAIHLPGYLKTQELLLNGEPVDYTVRDGYAYIQRKWQKGDRISLRFPMEVRRIYGSTRILDTAGKVCLARGPMVYCFEGVDNGEQLQALLLPRNAKIEMCQGEGLLKDTVILKMRGLREADSVELYRNAPPERTETELTAIPYYLWGNRGCNQMRVWMRESV